MKYCKKCLTPETRPRVVFNDEGICNACLWAERKETIDWAIRKEVLWELCNKYRRSWGFDVIVPVSGGKDGSYVAWKMKHDFDMHPLCVTFSPPMQKVIGRINLENFRNSGFDLLEIRPNPDVYRRLCKRMFIESARSKFPFVIGIGTAVAQIAINMGIFFVIYGEEGETEYGGADQYADMFTINEEFLKIYHEGHNMRDYLDEFTEHELKWWYRLGNNTMKHLDITWWSKYESWDDKLHADLAIEKCGMKKSLDEVGTFTDYAQLDDILQDLHMYECFIKYGTGRATADVNLAIKGGHMTREEGVEIVREMDGIFPIEYLQDYLEYFEMEEAEFWEVIQSHVNLDIIGPSSYESQRPWILKKEAY